MILADSSVWIDYFRGKSTAQTGLLEGLLDAQELAVGDLNLIEMLQGCRVEKEFKGFDAFEKHLGLMCVCSDA